MRRLKEKVLAVVMILAITLPLGACSLINNQNPLVGRWEFVSGGPVYFFLTSNYMEFFETGTVKEYEYNENGTWSINGNNLTIVGDWTGTESFTYAINANKLTLTDRDGDSVVYQRTQNINQSNNQNTNQNTNQNNNENANQNSNQNVSNHELVGRWGFESGSAVYYFLTADIVEFSSDSSVKELDYNETGTWSISGNTLTVVGDWTGTENFTYSINGTRLTLTDRDGDTAVYQRL